MAKLKPSELHPAKDDTMLRPMQLSLFQNELTFATPESVAEHKNQTSNDKLTFSNLDIQMQRSLQRLAAGSSDPSCLPYWNESCKVLSDVLLWSTKTGWQDMPDGRLSPTGLTCSDGYASGTGVNSWFSMTQTLVRSEKSLKTSSPSCTASAVGFVDCASTKLQSKKIRIYPEPALAKIWKQWQAACRYCYNQAIAYQRQHGRIGKYKLRNLIMNSDLPEWVKATPCHIRQNAIFEAWQAFKQSPKAKFRSVRDRYHTLQFNNTNFADGTWYPRLTKGLTFTASEPIPNQSYGTELTRIKDRWYAIFPEPVNEQCTLATGVIALDPGVRTFLTGFDGCSFLEFGAGDFGRIARLCHYLDDLISRMSKVNAKRRRRMRMAAYRLRQRIRNLVDECHKQVANYLTKNYRIIFLPTFESADMVAKAKRPARAMLTWAHYRFKQFLKFQAQKKNVISEAYTSKTCTRCGHVHHKLGGAKVFKCPACGYQLPRDWNGAFGILLKALRDTATVTLTGNGAIVALSREVLENAA